MRHETLRPDLAKPVHGPLHNPSPLVVVGYTSTRYPMSKSLQRGAQRELMNAAVFSAHIGFPINTLTTINAAHLQRLGDGGVFSVGHLWDGFRDLFELMRKWTTARDLPWIAIWSREHAGKNSKQPGEHWHIGHHLTTQHHRSYTEQLSAWTGEDHDQVRLLRNGDVAFSTSSSWNIKARRNRGQGPEGIAAYLGKSEPNRITLHGKVKDNPDKVQRKFGGEGPIEGKRYGISRAIHRKEQKAKGFRAPYRKAAAP